MRMPTAMKPQIGGAARGSIPTTASKRAPGTAIGGGSQSGGRPMTAVSGAGYNSKPNQIVGNSSNSSVTLEPKIET
jgi:hypothetical protein